MHSLHTRKNKDGHDFAGAYADFDTKVVQAYVGKDMGKPMGITAPTHIQPTSYPYPPTHGYLISWVTQMGTWVPTHGGLTQGFTHIKIQKCTYVLLNSDILAKVIGKCQDVQNNEG